MPSWGVFEEIQEEASAFADARAARRLRNPTYQTLFQPSPGLASLAAFPRFGAIRRRKSENNPA
jgi:hypothetical protein